MRPSKVVFIVLAAKEEVAHAVVDEAGVVDVAGKMDEARLAAAGRDAKETRIARHATCKTLLGARNASGVMHRILAVAAAALKGNKKAKIRAMPYNCSGRRTIKSRSTR